MTMRSMPPSSSHFAESPVPAPPPMIGSPRAIIARNFSRICCRGIAMLLPCLCPPLRPPAAVKRPVSLHDLGGEFGGVDVMRKADELPRRGLAHRRLQRAEQRLVS